MVGTVRRRRPRWRLGILALAILGTWAARPPALGAQVEASPELRGRVVRGQEPLEGVSVVLHRVSPDSAGVLGRVPTDPDGRFTLSLPHVPDPQGRGEVYFASVRHQGVLYFGGAVSQAVQLDSLYRIEVHDTAMATPSGALFPVTVRNLFLERTEEGWRVVDLIQVQNEGERTLVAPEDGIVWSYPLPTGATNFQVGESDLAPDAVRFVDGNLRVSSPVPPGERTYMVRYRLPDLEFALPLPGRTGRVEMLIEEPAPPLEAPGLTRLESVELEAGASYRRYAASGLESRVIRISPGDERGTVPVGWIAVILALVLTGAGILALRGDFGRSTPRAAAVGDAPDERDAVLLRIAQLDDRFQDREAPNDAERRRYEEERARLKARLRELE
ncbi:MAG: hypothetical protein GWM92_05640 [Gemmatimonadetes bacterium]|nr:hypothetical protein [Gemmatimonadota bacterium]NIR80131.1 hypothetical protein [Gemmatimonadota bacterium]NIT86628.1 hypothetical protein [Gemmatimonadota bacterium]NIU30475.1 hypothetical protein [Gemmatimonadota bacterium]NIU37125.1 hypothetical protein [Gemmatimonadota bacterium]